MASREEDAMVGQEVLQRARGRERAHPDAEEEEEETQEKREDLSSSSSCTRDEVLVEKVHSLERALVGLDENGMVEKKKKEAGRRRRSGYRFFRRLSRAIVKEVFSSSLSLVHQRQERKSEDEKPRGGRRGASQRGAESQGEMTMSSSLLPVGAPWHSREVSIHHDGAGQGRTSEATKGDCFLSSTLGEDAEVSFSGGGIGKRPPPVSASYFPASFSSSSSFLKKYLSFPYTRPLLLANLESKSHFSGASFTGFPLPPPTSFSPSGLLAIREREEKNRKSAPTDVAHSDLMLRDAFPSHEERQLAIAQPHPLQRSPGKTGHAGRAFNRLQQLKEVCAPRPAPSSSSCPPLPPPASDSLSLLRAFEAKELALSVPSAGRPSLRVGSRSLTASPFSSSPRVICSPVPRPNLFSSSAFSSSSPSATSLRDVEGRARRQDTEKIEKRHPGMVCDASEDPSSSSRQMARLSLPSLVNQTETKEDFFPRGAEADKARVGHAGEEEEEDPEEEEDEETRERGSVAEKERGGEEREQQSKSSQGLSICLSS